LAVTFAQFRILQQLRRDLYDERRSGNLLGDARNQSGNTTYAVAPQR